VIPKFCWIYYDSFSHFFSFFLTFPHFFNPHTQVLTRLVEISQQYKSIAKNLQVGDVLDSVAFRYFSFFFLFLFFFFWYLKRFFFFIFELLFSFLFIIIPLVHLFTTQYVYLPFNNRSPHNVEQTKQFATGSFSITSIDTGPSQGPKNCNKGSPFITPPQTKTRATCLAIADTENQVWVGTQEGELHVYDIKTTKDLYHKKDAHTSVILCLRYLRGHIWSSSMDYMIHMWSCGEIPRETPDKAGYLYKLSPASKVLFFFFFFFFNKNFIIF
jgi:hypothetical protein